MSSSFGKQNFSVADFDLLFSWMVLLDGGQKGQNQVSFLTIFPLRSLSLNSEVRRAFPGDIPPPSAGCLPIPFTCPTFAAPLLAEGLFLLYVLIVCFLHPPAFESQEDKNFFLFTSAVTPDNSCPKLSQTLQVKGTIPS